MTTPAHVPGLPLNVAVTIAAVAAWERSYIDPTVSNRAMYFRLLRLHEGDPKARPPRPPFPCLTQGGHPYQRSSTKNVGRSGRPKILVVSVNRLREAWGERYGGTVWKAVDAVAIGREVRTLLRKNEHLSARVKQWERWADLVTVAIQQMAKDQQAWIEAGGHFPATPEPVPEPEAEEDDSQDAAFDSMSTEAARRGIL